MRILIVSDIHSNLSAFEAVLSNAGTFDAAISAGDIVGYGPNPLECIDKSVFRGFQCVAGNHDHAVATVETDWFNDDAKEAIRINRCILPKTRLSWLSSLPLSLRLELEGIKLVVYHGSPTQPLTSYIFPDDAERYSSKFLSLTKADILILGHTHIPYQIMRQNKLLINPGSVGQPRDGDPRASYMIIETNPIKVKHKRVEYNIDVTSNAIDAQGIPHRFATRLYKGF